MDDNDEDDPQPGPPASDEALTFSASDWKGAFQGDQSWYGRPWVAIYGQQSRHPRATLRFDLPAAPEGRMLLTLTGLGDETGEPFPFRIEVNKVAAVDSSVFFPNWNPDQHGWNGANAPWGQIQINIPGDLLKAGKNEIAIVSLKPGDQTGRPPYILLSDATLEPAPGAAALAGGSGSAAIRIESMRLDSKGKPKESSSGKNRNSGSGSSGNSGKGGGSGKDKDKD